MFLQYIVGTFILFEFWAYDIDRNQWTLKMNYFIVVLSEQMMPNVFMNRNVISFKDYLAKKKEVLFLYEYLVRTAFLDDS